MKDYDANVLVSEAENADFFEAILSSGDAQNTKRDPKAVANMVIGSVFAGLNKINQTISECPVTPEQVGQLIDLMADGTISGRIAKDVFDLMFYEGEDQGRDPADIVESKGLEASYRYGRD